MTDVELAGPVPDPFFAHTSKVRLLLVHFQRRQGSKFTLPRPELQRNDGDLSLQGFDNDFPMELWAGL